MNRYQLEIARLDQRHRRVVHTMAFASAAALAALALWSAGFNQGHAKKPAQSRADIEQHREAVVANTTPNPVQSDQPASPGRLRLMSTSPGRHANEGTAQLGTEVSHPQTYGAGALLWNGTLLKEIHQEYVLLERDGIVSALYIDGVATRPGQKRSRLVVESVLLLDSPAAPAPLPPTPPTYTHLVRAAPHFDKEAVVGFDVYPGMQAGQFARLGLQAGDLLLRIDGTAVNDVSVLNSALRDLIEGHSMTATVRRGGRELEISFDSTALERTSPTLAHALP